MTKTDKFLKKLFDSAPMGTRFSILDVFFKENSLSAKIFNLIGGGKFTGKYGVTQYVFETLKNNVSDYKEQLFSPFVFVNGKVIVGSGTK